MTDEASFEVRAKEMGWSPKEQFRGDPEKWIPAEEFVRRGEELLPIVRADNRKLRDEVGSLRGETQNLKSQLKAAQESIDALKEFNSAANREKVEAARRETARALKEAQSEGDTEKVLELQDQLEEQTTALREAKAQPKAPPTPPQEDPIFSQWKAENDWYGKDRRKTAFATGVAEDLRANGEKATGRAFLDKVAAEVDKQFNERPLAGKVEGDAQPGNSGGPRGRSFADLPADAKAACDRMATRLVGDGRAFKTIADWRKHYAAEYAWE